MAGVLLPNLVLFLVLLGLLVGFILFFTRPRRGRTK